MPTSTNTYDPDNPMPTEMLLTPGKRRILPLLFCVLGLGWVVPTILPDRFFFNNGIEVILLPLSLPLVLWCFLVAVRPNKALLTSNLIKIGGLTFIFTSIIGLILLFSIQSIGLSQLQHFKMYGPHNKYGIISSVLSWVIGWLYEGAFQPESVGIFHHILGFIFGVGLFEELTKILPVVFFLRVLRGATPLEDKNEFNLAKELVVVGIFSGLGFGIGEALKCYNPSSFHPLYAGLVTRWFACISLHAIWTGIVSILIWKCREELRKIRPTKELVMIIVLISMSTGFLHGIYDIICNIWILAVAANFVSIWIFVWLIRDSCESNTTTNEIIPDVITNSEMLLWNKQSNMIKFAAAYVIIIFVIGFFGSSQSFVAQPQSDFSSQQSYQDSHPSQVESKDSDYYYYKGAYSIGLEVDRDVSNEAVELIVRNSLSGNEFYHFRAAVDGMEDGVARRQMRRSYP